MATETSVQINETFGVCGGYPCIGKTRIRVSLIVDACHRTNDPAFVAECFGISLDQVNAAMSYYSNHAARIHDDLERNFTALRRIQHGD